MNQNEYINLRADIALALHDYFKDVSMPSKHFDWMNALDFIKNRLKVKDWEIMFVIFLEYGLEMYHLGERAFDKDKELKKIERAIKDKSV